MASRPWNEGKWEPLPKIIYGFVTYPFSPSSPSAVAPVSATPATYDLSSDQDDSPISNISINSPVALLNESQTGVEGGDILNLDLAPLEVGDEVYAFEKFSGRQGISRKPTVWYRGYILQSPTLPATSHVNNATTNFLAAVPEKATPEPPTVIMGVFPAEFIHHREELDDAEGKLSAAFLASRADTLMNGINGNGHANGHANGTSSVVDMNGRMAVLTEEDEEEEGVADQQQTKNSPKQRQTEEAQEQSVVVEKPAPPMPSLKAGDETVRGVLEPLVDEIACALREWYANLFLFLQRRDYELFHTVRNHIEQLHLGRRQLLAQNLSEDELQALRKECVARLVKSNVAQGLEVIVRHPIWGGLVTVENEGRLDRRSWVSGIRMYAMQVALAYIDISPVLSLSPRAEMNNKYELGPQSSSAGALLGMTHSSSISTLHATSNGNTNTNDRALGYQNSNGLTSPAGVTKFIEAPIIPPTTAGKFFHCFVDLRAYVANVCSPGETSELFFSIFNKSDNQFITEERLVIMNHQGVPVRGSSSLGKNVQTLFKDLGQHEVNSEIWLVCRIVRCGGMKISPVVSSGAAVAPSSGSIRSNKTSNTSNGASPAGATIGRKGVIPQASPSLNSATHYRRPLGCAVLDLSQLTKTVKDETTKPKEFSMQICVPVNEGKFAKLHEDIIHNRTREFERTSRAEMVAVNVKFFYGEVATIVKENPTLLQSVPLTSRFTFPDVVFPGDVRNDVYVKLWQGDFSSSAGAATNVRKGMSTLGVGPSSIGQSNVQVNMEVRTLDGGVLDDVISYGSGEPFVKSFSSLVFAKNNTPAFGEVVKLSIPEKLMTRCHLYFTFRQRVAKDKTVAIDSNGLERPFAFAYFPLFPDSQAFIPDGSHTLVLYRVDKSISITPNQYFAAPALLPVGSGVETLRIPTTAARTMVPLRDSLIIRSSLCSTTFTQSEVLLRLLNWEKGGLLLDKMELTSVLKQFTFVSEVEIVKVLTQIFDALFGILINNPSERVEIEALVFSALVIVLGIVQDRRFTNFKPVLDVYIEDHFSCASASSHLIKSMSRLLADPSSQQLRSAIKVWHYIFKFIIRARDLQKKRDVGMGVVTEHLETTFKKDLAALLRDFDRLMAASEPTSIIGTQTLALQHFSSILPDLANCFGAAELADIVISFSDSVRAGKGKAVIWKLILHLQTAKSIVFDDAKARASLAPALVRWVKPHLGKYLEDDIVGQSDVESARDTARIAWLEATRLSVTVVAVMLDKLQEFLISPAISENRQALAQEQDNIDYALTLLPKLLESYKEIQSNTMLDAIDRHRSTATMTVSAPVVFPSSYPFALFALPPNADSVDPKSMKTVNSSRRLNIGLGEVATVIMVLILVSPKRNLQGFLEEMYDIEGRDTLNKFLGSLFTVLTSIITHEAFPSDWLNISIFSLTMVLKIADPVSNVMEKVNIPSQEEVSTFDVPLWQRCLVMFFKLVGSDQLVIEVQNPQKRRAVWRLAGDVRGNGSEILARLWDSLGWPKGNTATGMGRYQIHFAPLVEDVLILCLSHHDNLRQRAVHILFSMIISEYELEGNFTKMEAAMIDKLNKIFTSGDGDDMSRQFFISSLRELFEESAVDTKFNEQIQDYLDSVDEFLILVLSLRDLPAGEEYKDDATAANFQLLKFIRRIGRDDIYIEYVHRMVQTHIDSGNWVEAGLTLKLHADLYQWDTNHFLEPYEFEDVLLPRQSHFGRKESLYLTCLEYLGEGKAFELAIELAKELVDQHSLVTFRYDRCSDLLAHQASLLGRILNEPRAFPQYFRVGFWGGFPTAIRNKQFVYRGADWEKYGGFCERLQNKHPTAKLMRSMVLPDSEITNSKEMWIQVTAVTPEPDRSALVFRNPEVVKSIKQYYETNNVQVFSFSRPLDNGQPTTTDREYVDTFLEKSFITCEDTFPTVLKRSEVNNTTTIVISPVERALSDILSKTEELMGLELKFSNLAETQETSDTSVLTMTLNSAVDSPINGGVKTFRKAFLRPDFLAKNPDKDAIVQELRTSIEEHALVIDRCLKLHKQLCPPSMELFHDEMVSFFKQNFAEEIARMPSSSTTSNTFSSPLSVNSNTNGYSNDPNGGTPRASFNIFPRSKSSTSQQGSPAFRPTSTVEDEEYDMVSQRATSPTSIGANSRTSRFSSFKRMTSLKKH